MCEMLTVPFTSLSITTPNANINGWDFFVDKIVLTGTAISAVPEPSSFVLLIVPISGLAFLRFFIDRAARKRSKDNFSQAPSHTHEQKLHWHETQQSRSQ